MEFKNAAEIKSLFAGMSRSDHNFWQNAFHKLTNMHGGQLDDWVFDSILKMNRLRDPVPARDMIEAVRKVGLPAHIETDMNFSGRGIIKRLAELQNPDVNLLQDKIIFASINKFVQEVTENETVQIEVPHTRDKIVVHMNGRSLPLESLGTGIHEVVILAVAATIVKNQILCLEEPELHLHPTLQRRLIRYLAEQTTNQYFITTHSSAFMDVGKAAVFRVWMENGFTRVSPAVVPSEKREACDDLGYRASDILQSNAVIWVEGPSDRIYLQHWIKAEDKDLIEGVHYSIMFYGGRLLSHLCADDSSENKSADDLISLREMNRNMVVVIDSDKDSQDQPLNSTKQRIVDEFTKGNGFAWVTAGREIENYIHPDILSDCLRETKAGWENLVRGEDTQYLELYPSEDGKSLYGKQKVNLAQTVAGKGAKLDCLDLREKMDALMAFIRKANGLPLQPLQKS